MLSEVSFVHCFLTTFVLHIGLQAHEHVPTPEGDVAGEYETPGTPEGRAESAWAVLGRGHLRKVRKLSVC